ncbi:MAG: L-serine ammonia-lyase, iron-sulfur-dependent, subunit alpha [Tissierellales bacterium]|jgi:L-serine dehydratase|nr:L-serine ammonia-lyase, iron-sulfur-dependent, subunit alpha [Tissierellales bacterium]
MYSTGIELLALAELHSCNISDIVKNSESESFETPIESIVERMRQNYRVMVSSSSAAIESPEEHMGHIIGGDGRKAFDHARSKQSICGELINKAMARAFSCSEVNASMGRICAAPTAGSCGIIPAVMVTLAEAYDIPEQKILSALFTAAGVGEIIARHATLSGAEGGCQAECGSASAMAAAASVELRGGNPVQCLHAASIALKNVMGLICDPIAGLVESPCAKRNASGAVNALISADMALAGIESAIPFDEVVDAMYAVGKSLPVTLRETALGGIAVTPTGMEISKKIHGPK